MTYFLLKSIPNHKMEQSEQSCGLLKLCRGTNSMVGSFSMDFMHKFGLREIVFDFNKMTFREPTIDDNKTYKICKCTFGFGYSSDIIGNYEIFKDGDIFTLNLIADSDAKK